MWSDIHVASLLSATRVKQFHACTSNPTFELSLFTKCKVCVPARNRAAMYTGSEQQR
jgi:hypothetical protein